MNKTSFVKAGIVLSVAMILGGCNHDDYDDGYYDDSYYTADGVYEGTITDRVTGVTTAITGIIDYNYEGIFATPAGQYYRLSNIGVSGTDFRANFIADSDGSNFVNGSSATSGSLSGQFTDAGLQLSFTAQGGDSGTLSLNFDNAYFLNSSLPTLAGSWSYVSESSVLDLTINRDGSFTGTDSNGCSYSGFFSLVKTNYNAYTENYNLSCGNVTTAYEGLSSYVPSSGSGASATPAQIILLADDQQGGFLSATVQQN